MAYIKYKELTKYFNFSKELDIHQLPEYIYDYIVPEEKILAAYATSKDKFVMTNYKIILFDVRGVFSQTKRIHFFPFENVSSTAIEFGYNRIAILLSMDSGYQMRLNFVKMLAQDKTKMRLIYMNMVNTISIHKNGY